MDIKKCLGQKVRKLRKEKGYSQEYFSELLELNPRQIVRIENGESFPTAENLQKIAKVLSVVPEELFFSECFMDKEYLQKKIIEKVNTLDSEKIRILYLMAINL